jgi:RNA polymerase sigma factor (sigma-70 family)
MDELADRFEAQRPRLRALAYRMLGSPSEAEDAVQETWIRLGRTDADAIEHFQSWLTTVLSRVCLNMLQARRARPEVPLDPAAPEPAAGPDPEHEALLADSLGIALLIVLETLSPAERVAFVLHDMFGVPFDDIAPILGRNGAATRQLASRARRRVQRQDAGSEGDRLRQAQLVDAFLAAARDGEFERLLALLDPDVVLVADETAAGIGVARELHGVEAVGAFARNARGATPALLGGAPALVWLVGGRPRVVYAFTVGDEQITGIELIADSKRLDDLDLVVLGVDG